MLQFLVKPILQNKPQTLHIADDLLCQESFKPH